MRKSNDTQCGQAALMMTLSLTVILGMLGLAVDVGWAYYRQQAAQAAADAAAVAAVRAAVTSDPTGPACANKVFCGAATNCPSVAATSPSTSFDNACMLAAANGFTTSGIDTVSVQAGISSPVPTVSGPAASYWAVVRVNEALPALFGAAFARGGYQPRRHRHRGRHGQRRRGFLHLCPRSQRGRRFRGGQWRLGDGGLRRLCGFQQFHGGHVCDRRSDRYRATTINVVGAFKKDNGGTTSVVPTTGAVSVADPFASLPSPTPAGSCQSGNFTAWQASPYTPAPGTYCGFSLGNGMSLQMSGGTYIIDGGTFSIQGGSTVTSSGGVLIYLTGGATVNIANGSTVTFRRSHRAAIKACSSIRTARWPRPAPAPSRAARP